LNDANSNTLAEAVRPVQFVEDLGGGVKRCTVCEYRCELAPGKAGNCRMRVNRDGNLVALNYGLISKADLDLVESRGFYHFFPGVKIFSLGSYGFNFPPAPVQENYVDIPTNTNLRALPIDRIAKFAIEQRCRGVVFAFSEPSMWYEYLLDACKSIRANGMFAAIVTNGYLTTDAAEEIGHYIDGMLVEVNAFSEQTFNVLTGQTQFQKVLETAGRAMRKYKTHIEIQTNLVPGVNDSDNEMTLLANWIKQVLGENTAWHLACAVPDSDDVLRRVKQVGEGVGLNYVYIRGAQTAELDEEAAALFDNTVNNNTYCYNCHKRVIDRSGRDAYPDGLDGGKCSSCETQLNIRSTLWRR
jgi:pyruvate formate lyase activating enzyme